MENLGQVTILQIVDVATNLTIIMIGFKLTRHMTRMEMKVELMWSRFRRAFDLREDDEKKLED